MDLGIRKQIGMAKACQRLSEIRTQVDHLFTNYDTYWTITIEYPEEVKIITQTKDVDVHSLIGNIGGYLGLFLGKPDMSMIPPKG